MKKLGLPARACHRVLKVAWTISSDPAGERDIPPQHAAEAVQYRKLDRQMPV